MKINKTKTALAVGAALAFSAGSANASHIWSFAGTFDFYDAGGNWVPTVDTDGDGAPDSNDKTVTGLFDLAAGSGSFDTQEPFNGVIWYADVDTMFQPAQGAPLNTDISWTWTNRTFAAPDFSDFYNCRTGVTLDGCTSAPAGYIELGSGTTNNYTFQLTNPGQFAAGVFFDWSTNLDIPVLAVMQGLDDPSDGVFAVASVDADGDGVPGTAMKTDPFPGQTPAFSGTMTCQDCAPPPAVPVPAAVWLFGSGLLGLVGVARRRA